MIIEYVSWIKNRKVQLITTLTEFGDTCPFTLFSPGQLVTPDWITDRR